MNGETFFYTKNKKSVAKGFLRHVLLQSSVSSPRRRKAKWKPTNIQAIQSATTSGTLNGAQSTDTAFSGSRIIKTL